MADATETIFLEASPLTTTDASGLTSDILSKLSFQPNYVLRSDPSVLVALSSTVLSADNDVFRVMLAVPSSMPDVTFYPIALSVAFTGEVAGTGFWDTPALYSIVAPVGTVPLQHAWRSFDLDALRTVFNGGVTVGYQTGAPVFQSFPPSPVAAVETAISAIGGFQFTISTFAAADLAAMNMSIDARWLTFPRSAVRNAGFYAQRMFFKTN